VDPVVSARPAHARRASPQGLLLLCLLLGASAARADFFSPGDLARAHAHLEGLSNCTKCHEAGQKLSQERCLACHTELAESIREGDGFHGRLPEAERAACHTCHREHHGRDFSLVDWGPKKLEGFSHAAKTGFALEGKHANVKCAECHEPRLVLDEKVRALLEKNPKRKTFLGLSTACKACHYDEHRGQLGTQCGECHTPKAWKPPTGFDHTKVGWALEGAHRKVSCTGCHTTTETAPAPAGTFPAPRSTTYARYEELPHASCADCHEDPHQGRFGERCESCHTVESWRQIRNAQKSVEFHDKTRFPLRGLHVDVACKSCHGPFPGQAARFRGLSFGSCEACHADAHLGQLAGPGGRSPPCDQCHSVDGFSPARFDVEAHAKTSWPLEGAHRAVACTGCHREEPALARKVPASVRQELARKRRPALFNFLLFDFPSQSLKRCESCHEDPHGGQFSAQEGCAACHQVESFHALGFQHDRDSRFPLTGKHASAACAACHPTALVKGREQVRYRPLETDCAACHEDVHAGQFAPAQGQPTDCARCHDTAGFTPTRFVHAQPFTDFLLVGRHTGLSCEKCHPSVPVGNGLEVRRYKGLPRTCEGCHADAHHGAFQGFHP
jgi:hypothetical protein